MIRKSMLNKWQIAFSLMLGLAILPAGAQTPGASGQVAALSGPVVTDPSTENRGPDVMAQPYLLAPLDVLDITVQNHDEMKKSVQVLADGTFDYPLVGTVRAAGKTAQQVAKIITKGISSTYNQPIVSITVVTSHVARISVLGIKGAGQVDFRPGMRVLDALTAAGGLSSPPEQTQAILGTDGGATTRNIDVVALMNGDVAQNVVLQPGDTLILTQRANATFTVQAIGSLVRPGPYSITPAGMTVMELLTLAGGATPTAALTQAQVLHDGHATSINLHALTNDLNDTTGSMKLVAGDTLLVPENKAKFAVLGEIRTPGMYVIPDGEEMTISQAVAQAGGPTTDGDKKQLAISRLGPDKKRKVITVNIEQMAKNNVDSPLDTPLLPGDLVFVPTRKKGHNVLDQLNSVTSLTYYLRVLGL